jgi:hypothetical protein
MGGDSVDEIERHQLATADGVGRRFTATRTPVS